MRVVHTWLGHLEYKPSDERHTGTPTHNAHTPYKIQHMFAIFMVTLDDSASESHGMAHTDVWKVVCEVSLCLESFMRWPHLVKRPNLIIPHQAAYGRSGKTMKSWQCFCCLMVGVVHGIVVQQQHLAFPFSFVLLDFVMMVCEGVNVTVVPVFGKANYTEAMAYCLTSLVSFMLKTIKLLMTRFIREEGFLKKKKNSLRNKLRNCSL
jgi:hypothetical protein